MGHRSHTKSEVLLDSVNSATAGPSDPMLVTDFRHVVLAVAGANSPDLTVQVKGAITDDKPDFSSAADADNPWDYVQTINLNDESSNSGDGGISFSGTAAVEQLEINKNLLTWVAVEVTSHTNGNATVVAKATGN